MLGSTAKIPAPSTHLHSPYCREVPWQAGETQESPQRCHEDMAPGCHPSFILLSQKLGQRREQHRWERPCLSKNLLAERECCYPPEQMAAHELLCAAGSSQWGWVEQALILHMLVKDFSVKGSHSNSNLATCELTSEP